MAAAQTPLTIHPSHPGARLLRAARGLRHVRGWTRLSHLIAPRSVHGRFTVANDGVWFAGDLAVLIDREVYINGGYEREDIALFLSCVPEARRGTILDIGCNVGTHSLAFSRAFGAVHAFDPNPAVWAQFETNLALNEAANVTLHRVGVGSRDAEAPLYSIDNGNAGLATFSDSAQYDAPLQPIGVATLVHGDRYVNALGLGRLDAVKIDVQGLEAEVLRGLQAVLARDRPVVWVEAGGEAEGAIRTLADLAAHFPYPVQAVRLNGERGLITHRWRLKPAEPVLASGDYVVRPRG